MPPQKEKKEIGENAQISTLSFLNKTNITNNHDDLLHLGKYSSISTCRSSKTSLRLLALAAGAINHP